VSGLGISENLRVGEPLAVSQLVDPTWPKGYSIPYNVMLGNKNCDRGRRVGKGLASKVAIERQFHQIRGGGIFWSNRTPTILPCGNIIC